MICPSRCPICCRDCNIQAISEAYWCNTCCLGYYSIGALDNWTWEEAKDFSAQHPNQACYYYRYTFYTVPEMERIANLKAFL
jgi:hypothetical protein